MKAPLFVSCFRYYANTCKNENCINNFHHGIKNEISCESVDRSKPVGKIYQNCIDSYISKLISCRAYYNCEDISTKPHSVYDLVKGDLVKIDNIEDNDIYEVQSISEIDKIIQLYSENTGDIENESIEKLTIIEKNHDSTWNINCPDNYGGFLKSKCDSI